jgi:hypothetical protein
VSVVSCQDSGLWGGMYTSIGYTEAS